MKINETESKVNKMVQLKIVGAFAVAMLAFTGCANKAPTTGDFMRMHAAEKKETIQEQKSIATEWDKGSKLLKSGEDGVKNGEALVKSGDADMTKGKQQIEQGNKDIAEGTKIKADSEALFHEKYPELKLELK